MATSRTPNSEDDGLARTLGVWLKDDAASAKASRTLAACAQAHSETLDLRVFITPSHEQALASAKRSDDRYANGSPRALEGSPIAVKDNFCTLDLRTTAGSKILETFVPTYESAVTQRILDAGAVIVGKTNLDEFGMGSSTENSAFGPTINPRGVGLDAGDYVPGGSSGGSAAAVAANLCLAALGTDTGGSIRQPASFCGVVGFKPTYGLCSRWGIIAYASSLDQAGVITKTVEDAALMMDVIVGKDERDSTSIDWPGAGFADSLRNDASGATVGIPRQFREMAVSADLEALWLEIEARLARAGARVRYVDMPRIGYSLPAYYIVALCEASSNLARYDGIKFGRRAAEFGNLTEMYENTRAEGFGEEVKRRILLGTFALSSGYYDQYYLKASRVRRLISQEFADLFSEVDVLAFPTAPTPAFKIGGHTTDPVAMYLEDVFTVPASLAGLPAISIPGITAGNGLPMGLQIVGPRLSDDRLLAIAKRLEDAKRED